MDFEGKAVFTCVVIRVEEGRIEGEKGDRLKARRVCRREIRVSYSPLRSSDKKLGKT